MKRSAATLGPTPQFIRWAIDRPCPLREIDLDDLPNSTFRQLRSLRAVAEGHRDGRVFEGICFHETVNRLSTIEHIDPRGFLVDEIYSLFGGQEFVQSCCGDCTANADDGGGAAWAGCYGWLAADPGWRMSTTPQPETKVIDESLVDVVSKSVVELQAEFGKCFQKLPANWYGLWMPGVLTPEQVTFLGRVFDSLVGSNSLGLAQNRSFTLMCDAINRCQTYRLDLHVELVPSGYSDGVQWEIFGHCPNCKLVSQDCERVRCPGCNSEQKPVESRKQKVLGFRPYLKLKDVLGETETVRLVCQYLDEKD